MAKEETGNQKEEQSMREDWLSDLAPLSDSVQHFYSGKDIPISEEETADLLDEVEFRFSGNQSIDETEDSLLMEALVLGSPVDGEQDKDAPKLSEEKMQILLGEVRTQLSTPSVESTPRKTRKIIPFKPILSTLAVAAAVMLGFFIFKGDPSVDPGAVAQDQIDTMPQGGAILLAFNGEAQVSEMEGDEKMDFRTLEDGDLLAPGMELKTGAESEAVLLLTNGSLATLGPDSQMRLAEFTQEAFEGTEEKVSELTEEPSESHVLLELDLGELVVEVKKLDKQSSFVLYSHLGFAGIRGTQYRALATDRSVRLSVLEGKVAVSKERGGLDHLIESERAILLEEDLQKEPDGATVEEIERIKRVNERARKLAEKIKLKDLAEAYDEINKRLALALKEKELEQAMNKAIDEGTYIVESAANMEMIWCKPGSFMMGSPRSEKGRGTDETMHKVTLTEGFYLGKYEVTQEQYEKVMGKNPSKFKGKKLPVEMVSWNDAMEFCKRLTGLEKKEGRVPDGWNYVLPTEAQWEYACRAGTATAYSWGKDINSARANYNWDRGPNDGADFKKTRDVGQYAANPWGLFDMHGNVWEWITDWKANYPGGAVTNPQGPASGSLRVLRGGSWYYEGSLLRSAKRSKFCPPGSRYGNVGFRLCLKEIKEEGKQASIPDKVNLKEGLALVEEEFEEAMKKPVGEGIHIVESANNMEMIWCKPGSFIMGSPKNEEGRNNGALEDQYEATLTKGFFLGKYEVTQSEWVKIMDNNPSTFKGDQRPVETVSWLQEIEFCKKLTDLERKANRLSEDWYFTLPTEAEWEYACRAGTTSIFSWGNNVSSDQANFDATQPFGGGKSGLSLGETKDVGSYFANPWGFYDMHGNVVEKVYDWKGKYPERKAVDPMGPAKGSAKLSRGGSYMQSADQIRSARRGNGGTLRYKGKHAGFRLCLKEIKEEGKQEVIPLKSLPKEARSEQKDDKSFSADLLAAVKNWKVIPKSVFPLSNVTIQKEVEVENYSRDGKVISKSNLSVGREVVVLGHKEDLLTISPSRTSLSRGSIKIEDTDFKNSVAALFELRKKQKEVYADRKKLNDSEIQKKPNYIVKSAINMELIWCKPGNFVMGSPKSEKGRDTDETIRQVTLTEGFYLGKYEVTQGQYEKVMGKNPSNFKGKKLPVETVSWNDAMEFCKRLTGLEKKEGLVPEGWNYVLPTEAQWEYACRAGTATAYSWGNDISSARANYNWDRGFNDGADFKKTRDVGQYSANAWGFFDMHGNVWEWISDWKANYPGGVVTNPKGPASGSYRVTRGGSWHNDGTYLRSAKRSHVTPSRRNNNLGFRVGFQKGK